MKPYRSIALLIPAVLLFFGIFSREAEAAYYISGEETLWEAADQTGMDPELLAAINNVEENASLSAGTLLSLPEEPVFTITVKAGDTLYSLAREYQVELADLVGNNNIANAARIWPGQTLTLPLKEEQSVFSLSGEEAVPVLSLSSRSFSYLWPAEGVISSRFGERDGGFHYGLDVAADLGTPIVASLAGVVTEADWKNDAYGYTVMLSHGNGNETLYAHCEELLVDVGDTVKKGQAIALMGSTGNSTGPHVHFEVRINNVCEDPLLFLR